ncbi:MAG: thymidine phosphorylase [Spirochaetales bacterium]|nr:thymidine phosphorylase [Spirochaetales bacterium]
MHIIDLINKKKHKKELDGGEIRFFIDGVAGGAFQDYQVSALLMAIWCQGMTREETVALTLAMAESGDMIDLGAIPGIKVDKHSTGGVADTTTLIVAPLVAACGGTVAKMSGRGLGHTGGTIDKLESIPGFRVSLTMDEFTDAVRKTGLCVIGQTASLVPADKILYALRDVTGTIDCLPLIASSIMSKKLASGSNAIVLDVKTGSGAFMKNPEDSRALARIMVDIGNDAGRTTRALVTNMDQPLGNAVGNALEVREAIEILSGRPGGDLLAVSLALAGQMLIVSGICADEAEAEQKLKAVLESGKGLDALANMISQQGGNAKVLDNPGLLPQARRKVEVYAPAEGFLHGTDAEGIGRTAQLLGAGRMKKTDIIDPAAGLWMKVRIGQQVGPDTPAAVFHVNNESNLDEAMKLFRQSLVIGSAKQSSPPLVYGKPVC